MFSAEEVLLEHGLAGAFDTMAMIHDEELAIITKGDQHRIKYLDSEGDGSEHHPIKENDVEAEGVTFVELQMSSQELAAHLYHRFGVRKGDTVLILCHGHSAAEVYGICSALYHRIPPKIFSSLRFFCHSNITVCCMPRLHQNWSSLRAYR